ncbi:diguanylate cyclase [Massilia sp. CF038]|uniref:GGDEF domain-containing protein n=1 Tax=Massilia sp. CF038 TaxID=1881045 RepID=UPI0009127FE4|nr:GGDEF domain-containing protein [Massilia sp. CF038]SHH67722.1 diguanylate cyclase (GGDEF) domain-containing protein [Massilia sp. CF038]
MLNIDPELLSNASPSPYRTAFEKGYRALRFDEPIEQEFQAFYTEGHLMRVRLAAYLIIVLYAAFVIIDITTLPAEVAYWTTRIRIFFIIPPFFLMLYVSYQPALRGWVRKVVPFAAITAGVGTTAVIGAAYRLGTQIPYEGILLVALFIYLIACLQWRRALFANGVTLAAFIAMEFMYQSNPQFRLYQIIFMIAANAVGAYGGYFLEHSARTMFLVNNLLNELAELDGLTGLSNRRTLNIHLDRIWRQAIRDQQAVAIAMIDVDHFKKYNDRYGHAQGDAALRAVADVIAHHARRPLDITARYGGEEFAVVWYHPSASELARMAEILTRAIVALDMPHADNEIGKLSISVGVAMMTPSAEQSSADLLRAADGALYDAKAQGRNRVVVAVPEDHAASPRRVNAKS